MKLVIDSTIPKNIKASTIVIPINQYQKPPFSFQEHDSSLEERINSLLKSGEFSGKMGEMLLVDSSPNIRFERAILLGIGKNGELNEHAFSKILTKVFGNLEKLLLSSSVAFILDKFRINNTDTYKKIRICSSVLDNLEYRFDRFKKEKILKSRIKQVTLLTNEISKENSIVTLNHSKALSSGTSFARDLGNLPANICTPEFLVNQALALEKEYSKIKVDINDKEEIQAMGMEAFHAVGKGSINPPYLITIHYSGGNSDENPYVIIGKGITFDSGGISIKPASQMHEMKYDMCGAASVFGTLKTVSELNLPINVVGIIPCAENMPGGNAYRPGDIIKTMSGQTVEVLNTDAEGRLILCDALTYAKRFNPKTVIDIATLTGACVVALGSHASGLMGNNNALIQALTSAGEKSADRVWNLPICEEYQEQLESCFADMSNIGGPTAGAITAACFLSNFAKEYQWAHLDIAGTAWNGSDSSNKTSYSLGATGRPVPLLTQYLIDCSSH